MQAHQVLLRKLFSVLCLAPCFCLHQGCGTPNAANDVTYQVHTTDKVFRFAFSPDSKLLAYSTPRRGLRRSHSVAVINVADGTLVSTLEHSQQVVCVAFSPDGKMLASDDGPDGAIRLWDTKLWKPTSTLKGHTSYVTCLAFSKAGQLASASLDGSVRIWDVAKGEELHKLGGFTRPVKNIVFSPNGKVLVTGGGDGRVTYWSAGSYQKVTSFVMHQTKQGVATPVTCVGFAPSGTLVASGGSDGTAKIWGFDSHRVRHVFDVRTPLCVTFSPDGKSLFCVTSNGNKSPTEIVAWDVRTGDKLGSTTDLGIGGGRIQFSPNGEIFAIGSRAGMRVIKTKDLFRLLMRK